ncbi:MAG: tetratricopeptide repeat protein [Candidatus Accumulibacter sp. UW25]|jgi:tetratricopeptide (TPR) repeat protein
MMVLNSEGLPSLIETTEPPSLLTQCTERDLAEICSNALRTKDRSLAAEMWGRVRNIEEVSLLKPIIFEYLGESLRLGKRLAEARAALDLGFSLFPDDFGINRQIGELALAQHDYKAAIKYWLSCFQHRRGKVPFIYRKLSLALRRAGSLDRSREIVDEGAALFPENIPLLAEALDVAAECGLWAKIMKLAPVLILNKEAACPRSVYLSYSRALQQQGDGEESIEILKQAMTAFPQDAPFVRKCKDGIALATVGVEVISEIAGSYKVTYYRQITEASKIFFTFGIRLSDFDTRPFGFPFLTNAGFDHVHVAQAAGTQYQNLSIEQFRSFAIPLCRNKEVFTYGSSLGAYAAIYFADSIAAQAIAGSPILPAHDLARRYPNDKIRINHVDLTGMNSSTSPVIFFDPHNRDDKAFVKKCILPGFPFSRLFPLEFSGHESLRLLQDVGVLKDAVMNVVRRSETILDIAGGALEASVIYLQGKAEFNERQGQHENAISIARQCNAAGPSLRAYNTIIRSYVRLGLSSMAETAYLEALRYYPDSLKLIRP